MKKSLFVKVILLLLAFFVCIPTMTGCGLNLGADGTILVEGGAYNSKKPAGKFFNTYVYVASPYGEGQPDEDDGMVKRPFLVYGAGSGEDLNTFQDAMVKLPVEHMIAHLAVAVCGAQADCGIYSEMCFVGKKGILINFDPFSMANQALGIGSSIAGAVAGFSTGLAAGMMVAVWFGNMLMLVIQERFTMEALLKGCMHLIVGLFVVYNARTFAQIFVGLLQGNTNLAGENQFAQAAGAALSDIKGYYAALGVNIPVAQVGIPVGYVFMDDIGTAATIAIGCIMVLGAQISCAVACVSAMVPVGLEMTLRIQLAPLIFAMSAQTGWTPSTINYLKGCVAAGLTPTLIAMMVARAPEIADSFAGGNLLAMAIAYTIVYKSMGGFIGQASQITHQVLSH